MFNLSKFSALESAPSEVLDTTRDMVTNLRNDVDQFNQPRTQLNPTDRDLNSDDLDPEQQRMNDMLASVEAIKIMEDIIQQQTPETQGAMRATQSYQTAQNDAKNFDPGSFGYDSSAQKKSELSMLTEMSKTNPKFEQIVNQFRTEIGRADRHQEELTQLRKHQAPQFQQQAVMSFNLKKWKMAQNAPLPQQPSPQPRPAPAQQSFPVVDAGDFASKFMSRILSEDPNESVQAVEEILQSVKGELQSEEINSMLQTLRTLDYEREQAKALAIFGQMFDILPGKLKSQEMQPQPEAMVMSHNNPKGIIKYNLTDHILNNNDMTKTAADHFGQEYVLYGPTEKRICPKLRGKGGGQPGSGDVVSEYVCRHHCLDGIVIDDNKTICGEALWRSSVMDKFSREYVNEDGETVGGYLNKRFEINRNVPEENKMRLKPGETRKPRPPSWGSLESRLQDMRKKEGEKRDYRPDVNTGDAFEWCHDVDQNNVDASQSERDRREKAMGHQLVDYSNKDQQENKPKTAFNLKRFKTAQGFNPLDPSGTADTGPTSDMPLYTKILEMVQSGRRNNEIITTLQLQPHQIKWVEQARLALGDAETESEDNLGAGGDIYNRSKSMQAPAKAMEAPKPMFGATKSNIGDWARQNLDNDGKYIGPDLSQFGFTIKPGTTIMPSQRYDVMNRWNVANKQKEALQKKDVADNGISYSSTKFNLKNFKQAKCKSCKCKTEKSAQFGSIPLPQDGEPVDKHMQDPKLRQPKPMLGLDSPSKSNPSMEVTTPESEQSSVAVPGGEIVSPQEADRRKKKNLASELMEFNTIPGGAISQIATSLVSGDELDPNLLQQAIKELDASIDPNKVEQPEAITPEMQTQIEGIKSKLQEVSGNGQSTPDTNGPPEPWDNPSGSQPPMSPTSTAFNLKQFKTAKKKVNTSQVGSRKSANSDFGSEPDIFDDNYIPIEQDKYDDVEIPQDVFEIMFQIPYIKSEDEVLSMLQAHRANQRNISQHDWHEIINVANEHLKTQLHSTNHIQLYENQLELAPNSMYRGEESSPMLTANQKTAQAPAHLQQYYQGLGGKHTPTLRSRFDIGQNLVDKKRGPLEILDIGHNMVDRFKRKVKHQIMKPNKNIAPIQNQAPVTNQTPVQKPKPMADGSQPDNTDNLRQQILQLPGISNLFQDIDELDDLLDSLNADELRIIVTKKDPQVLMQIKQEVENDLNDTAKQLEMDD